MSKKTRPDLSRLLSRVPNVDSPRDLDQKILAESRRLTPERQGRYLRGWMPVTATVCMIGLAVFVAKPVLFNLKQTQRVQTAPLLQKQEVPVQDTSKNDQSQDVDRGSNEAMDNVMEDEAGTPELNSKIVPVTEMAVSQSILTDEASENLPAAEMRQEFKVKKSSSGEKEHYPTPGSSSEAPESTSITKEQGDSSMGAAISEPMMVNSVPGIPIVSEEDLAIALQEIKSLIEAGDLKAADSRLEALRLRCPNCEVPDSLDDF